MEGDLFEFLSSLTAKKLDGTLLDMTRRERTRQRQEARASASTNAFDIERDRTLLIVGFVTSKTAYVQVQNSLYRKAGYALVFWRRFLLAWLPLFAEWLSSLSTGIEFIEEKEWEPPPPRITFIHSLLQVSPEVPFCLA